MSITILKTPAELGTVKNPMRFQVSTSDPENVRYVLFKIYAESGCYENDFENILPDEGSWEAPVESDGTATFWVNEILDEILGYELFEVQSNLPKAGPQLCKRYYITFGEFISGEPEFIRPDNKVYFALNGRFAWADFPDRAWQLLPENKEMLSDKPAERFITDRQHEMVYFLFKSDGNRNISQTVFYTDGTTEVVTKSIYARKFEPFGFPVGFATENYDLLQPGKMIERIEIARGGGTTTTVTDTGSPMKYEYVGDDVIITRNDGLSFIDDDDLHNATQHSGIDYNFKFMVYGGDPRNSNLFGYEFKWVFRDYLTEIGHSTITLIGAKNILTTGSSWAGQWWALRITPQGTSSNNAPWRFYGGEIITQTSQNETGEMVTLIPFPTACLPAYKEFYYQNSLGGIDSFVCTGDFERIAKIEQDKHQHYVPADYELQAGEYDNINTLMQEGGKVFSGFKTQEEIEAAKYFLSSEKRWELQDGRLFPILLTSKKMDLPGPYDNVFTLEFEYRYAYDF